MITTVKKLHNDIQEYIQVADYEPSKLEGLLQQLSSIAKTETFYTASTTHYFNTNQLDEMEPLLQEGLLRFSYSYPLHFNSAMFYYTQQQYEKTFYHFGKCLRLATDEDELKAAENNVQALKDLILQQNSMSQEELKELLLLTKKISDEKEEREYPIDKYGESLIQKVQNVNTEYENMTNTYKSPFVHDVNRATRYFFKTEYFLGKSGENYEFNFNSTTTLPLSYLHNDTRLFISIDGEEHNYTNSTLKFGQYNYLTFEKGNVTIQSNKPIFIGHPIPLIDQPKKYKLILHTFIDGLSGVFLEKNKSENLLGRTLSVFQNHYVNNNCYASADWTFPSNAGTVTAMDTVAHGQYHPHFSHDFSEKQMSLIEKIRKDGYFTASFTGDWRGTPPHGYGKSYNRIVYKNSVGGFATSELMDEVIDHLETFKDKNNYVWIVLPDLHDVADELFMGINSQVATKATNRLNTKKASTTVQSKYDEQKIARYKEELRRIDLHLSNLLHYVKGNYKEDEVLIIIHSDHGQGYFVDNPSQFLHEERTKVPFMLLGGIEEKVSSKLMSNLDIYPTILSLLDIPFPAKQLHGKLLEDFGGEKREFVFTESYHPDREYRAVIHSEILDLYFETPEKVDLFGRVDLENYIVSINIKDFTLPQEQIKAIQDNYIEWIIKKRIVLQK